MANRSIRSQIAARLGALALLCSIPAARADDSERGVTLGAGIGSAAYQLTVSPKPVDRFGLNRVETDTDASATHLRLGYRVHRLFEIEAGWLSVGRTGAQQGFVPQGGSPLDRISNETDDISGATLHLIGHLPRVDRRGLRRVGLLLKVGALAWRTEASGGSFVLDDPFGDTSRGVRERVDGTGTSLALGIGFEIDLAAGLSARFDLDHYESVGESGRSRSQGPEDSVFPERFDIGFEEDLDVATAGIRWSF